MENAAFASLDHGSNSVHTGANHNGLMELKVRPHDAFREGLVNADQLMAPTHPLANIVGNNGKVSADRDWEIRMEKSENMFGLGSTLKMRIDNEQMKQFHRFPGVPSSFLGSQIITGKINDMDNEDWLGNSATASIDLPDLNPSSLHANFHSTMEAKFKMGL